MTRDAHTILVRKPLGKRPIERLGRQEDYIQTDLEDRRLMELTHDRVEWRVSCVEPSGSATIVMVISVYRVRVSVEREKILKETNSKCRWNSTLLSAQW
jgi:hypothetical protein